VGPGGAHEKTETNNRIYSSLTLEGKTEEKTQRKKVKKKKKTPPGTKRSA